MSNSLNSDQARHFVRPVLSPNGMMFVNRIKIREDLDRNTNIQHDKFKMHTESYSYMPEKYISARTIISTSKGLGQINKSTASTA